MFVRLARDRPVGFVPRAPALQRAGLAATGPVVLQFAAQFIGAEPIRQRGPRRAYILVLRRVIFKLALAIQAARGVGARVALGDGFSQSPEPIRLKLWLHWLNQAPKRNNT